MSQSLYTAMGGISAAQSQLNVVSNNIANINTVGFKSSNVTFQDIFSTTLTAGNAPTVTTGGKNPVQIGLGVQVGTIAKDFSSGTWSATGKATDIMIQGNGFFTVKSSDGIVYFTKAGNFSFDAKGDLVNAQGYKVMGADSLYASVGSDTNVNVPQKLVTSVTANTDYATKNVGDLNDCQITPGTFTINLTPVGGGAAVPVEVTIAADADGAIDASNDTMEEIADKIQNQLITDMGWDPADSSTWGVTVTCDATTGGKLNFKLANDGGSPLATTITDALSFTPGTSSFVLTTQLGSAPLNATTLEYDSKVLDWNVDITPVVSTVNAVSVSNYTIGPDGSIEATYSNGDKMTIEVNPTDNTFQFKYTTSTGVIIRGDDVDVNPNVAIPSNFQLQLTNVVNPEGLVSMGGNLFMPGPNAGDMIFTVGGAMGVGFLKSGGLEASNVDMSKQFSDMILAQRAVQANSRVFTATSDIMQTLVQLGR